MIQNCDTSVTNSFFKKIIKVSSLTDELDMYYPKGEHMETVGAQYASFENSTSVITLLVS